MTGSHGPRPTARLRLSPVPLAAPSGSRDLDASRRWALDTAAADADAELAGTAGRAALATVAYGDGFLALAVAGVVEDGSDDRLVDALGGIRTRGRRRVDVEFSCLTRSSPALMRFLGHVRLQQVTSHGRLELHRPPADLVSALAEPLPDQLVIHRPRPALRAL